MKLLLPSAGDIIVSNDRHATYLIHDVTNDKIKYSFDRFDYLNLFIPRILSGTYTKFIKKS